MVTGNGRRTRKPAPKKEPKIEIHVTMIGKDSESRAMILLDPGEVHLAHVGKIGNTRGALSDRLTRLVKGVLDVYRFKERKAKR